MRSFAARIVIVLLSASCLPAPAALGWSLKEHILMTQIAAQRLIADPSTPPAMKDWLKAASRDPKDMEGTKQFFLHQRIGLYPRGVDGLGFWSTMPDLDKGSGPQRQVIAPFGVGEAQLHFTDLELLNSDPAKQTYRDDLSHKPTLSDIPRDLNDARWKHAGMLPFRVEDCYKKVVAAIRDGRLTDKDGQYPRDEHAEKWAGYLAHYLEDNCQPHHATIDYMSRTYFGKSNPRSPNVHGNVEGTLADDDRDDHMALREEFWTLFSRELQELKDPTVATDPWAATIEVALTSYDALPLIGRAAMAGYGIEGTPEAPTGHPSEALDAEKFFHFKGKVGDREMTLLEMKAHQMAWAVKRVERVWRQAWDEANTGK
jgi:hypothetical protein